ncbi:MAG: pyrroloquinoline quinone biosynthesis peptide chaperone PqqD [Novosphingobium sp.]|nr:pyrroloquinoline quinone biosynthesis peptide chaperone PqqD [Novosphingobium sp.]
MSAPEADETCRVPHFRRGVKLRFDAARGQWVLLAPERAFVPNEIAAEILQLVDGERTVAAISMLLAEKFSAPLDVVQQDTTGVLTDLAARGAIDL